jgi:very-short-patch-repair endonuclease
MPFYYRKRGFGGYGSYDGYGYSRPRKRSDPAKFEKAVEMRNNPTKAEARMWDIIRHQVYQNFPNYIFYRQSVQYGYILDFYCPRLRLGIEVDGYVHNEQKEYDRNRDNALSRQGIEIHRYTNDDVLYSPQETTNRLYETLKYKKENPAKGIVAREGCFIATAAFGTPMTEEINILRRFRDFKMKPNSIGRNFVNLYYDLSPPLARLVAQSENMKVLVRLILKPIIRFLDKQTNYWR